jgi:hypothetical protein
MPKSQSPNESHELNRTAVVVSGGLERFFSWGSFGRFEG